MRKAIEWVDIWAGDQSLTVQDIVKQAQKEAYNQALIDIWAEIIPEDKNVRNGRYIVTSKQLTELEK